MITLEGVEGAGKSTQLAILVEYLQQRDIPVIATREPGGTPLGEKIRSVLLSSDDTKISVETELLLMFAARQQHMQDIVRPALDQGSWIVCDRFIDASYAYQSGGRGLDSQRIQQLEDWVLTAFKPDLTLLFDISVVAGFERIAERGKDRIEQEDISFFERVRATYLHRAELDQSRIKIINASLPVDSVAKHVQSYLVPLIESW